MAVLAAYGAFLAVERVRGDDPPVPAASGNGFVASTERAIASGRLAIRLGIDLRTLGEAYVFRDAVNTEIERVRTERLHLEELVPRTRPPRADTLQSAIQAMDRLENAMAQWRDAIFLLRLGNVDAAQAAINSAIADLETAIGSWNRQKGA